MNDHYKRRSHEREIREHNGPSGSKYDDPPNSRLFIVCGKSITEDDFKESFEPYGIIEEIWVLRDKVSNEPKGVTYIKFSKTSEAALAMEEMNGRCIGSHPRPLKVLIAHSRDQGSRREMNEEERLVRLFVVVPKTMSEADLKDYFNQFGDVDYVSIVRDRATKESKGFAYIKYHRMSHAAKAFEACDRSYKPVFADPKPQKSGYQDGGGGGGERMLVGGGPGSTVSSATTASMSATAAGGGGCYDMLAYMDTSHSNPEGVCRLTVVTSPLINQDQLWRLFDLVPGLDYCELKRVEGRGRDRTSKAIGTVVFNNPQSATYAKEKLHGFEYPPGHRLIVKFEEGSAASSGGGGHSYVAGPPPALPYSLPFGRGGGGGAYLAPPPMPAGVSPGSYPLAAPRLPPPPLAPPPPPSHHRHPAAATNSLPTDLQTLADTIAQATSIIQAAGYTNHHHHNSHHHHTTGGGAAINSSSAVPETYDPSYCSVKLPPPQPLAPPDSPVAERLFVVCTPYHPVIYILKDVFGRFGGLIDIYLLAGKTCGYAKYANRESAEKAVATLHGQEVCGNRLKVMLADPQDNNRNNNNQAADTSGRAAGSDPK